MMMILENGENRAIIPVFWYISRFPDLVTESTHPLYDHLSFSFHHLVLIYPCKVHCCSWGFDDLSNLLLYEILNINGKIILKIFYLSCNGLCRSIQGLHKKCSVHVAHLSSPFDGNEPSFAHNHSTSFPGLASNFGQFGTQSTCLYIQQQFWPFQPGFLATHIYPFECYALLLSLVCPDICCMVIRTWLLFAVKLLPFLDHIPGVVSNPGLPQPLLVSENYFTCLLHPFLHFIPTFSGNRWNVSKSGKSVLEHCLKSQLSGWVLKLTCVESSNHLIAHS